MIVQPKTRGFICTTAHPAGCKKHIQDQVDYVTSQKPVINGPKRVLVVGSSTGYGLASRIVAAFGGSRAATIGVFFEKESDGRKTATAGWYNSVSFEQIAHKEGLYAKSFNGDAFSDEMKKEVIAAIKKDLGDVDLVVYSLASPRRQHPRTGVVSKSVLKPIGRTYTNKSLDLDKGELEVVTLPEATQDEVDQTVAVMGGEDWEFWIDALEKEGCLAKGVMTIAYSYVGPELTRAVYRNGTIGRAKDHLEATAKKLHERLKKINGQAYVSVNKALVTQSSSAIPFIPLYFILLKKVMLEKKAEEGCIEQMYRLFATRLYTGEKRIPVDESSLIRMDDWEMRTDVQSEVGHHWETLNQNNLNVMADFAGFQKDFLKLFGFGLEGVDYSADVDIDVKLPSSTKTAV
jgi:enoyl-[acyl-carrier protein] reductase / trans-2-enoyl-CoA reductase (NAD+)